MAAVAAVSRSMPSLPGRMRRVGRETAYLLTGVVAGAVGLGAWLAGVIVSLTLGLMIVGFPVILGTFACFRWLTDVERRRAALVLGAPLPSVYRPAEGRMAERLKTIGRDPQRWKDVLYLALIGPVGFGMAAVAAALWVWALGCLLMPAWWWSVPGGVEFGWFTVDSWELALCCVPLGAALLAPSLAAQRGFARTEAAMARALLAPSLAERVERLTETRAAAVDAAAAELHRIERDLHDGAQARLVALAMDLGMAEERFDRDPDGARELVGEARREARRALAELRDLARGIRPSLLDERGLGAAVDALVARSPVPAVAAVELSRRPPAPVENAAWFVVSEALANAGKHSGAGRATVRIAERDGALEVEVADNGRGGADPAGAGLRGLAKRVGALDGSLEIDSPLGGPTVVRAVLPCGW
jgi:signal transduction histidine kinase